MSIYNTTSNYIQLSCHNQGGRNNGENQILLCILAIRRKTMKKRSIVIFLILSMILSSALCSFAAVDGKGHGYHYIHSTSSKYKQVYGHIQLPQYYAGSTALQTYPEVFYGIYAGAGLDIGLVYRPSKGWCPFAGLQSGASNTGKYDWEESSPISGLGPSDKVYMEANVEKRGSDYYLVLYCKENGSYNNKSSVLDYKLNRSWGSKVYNYGGIINREVSIASNDSNYISSGAYLYNAKWIDGGLVTSSNRTYAWGTAQSGRKKMYNDDGTALSKYYNVSTGTENGYATEIVSIDYRGGL